MPTLGGPGCFMIALAVGLEELAPERGIPVHQAIGVDEALSLITPAGIGLVCYDTPEGEGHISPLTGQEGGGELLLPLTVSA